MKPKVLIMRCDEYDASRIASIVREGMEELGVKPHGRTMLKPNTVIAHPEIFPHAFTRAEFLDGVLSAIRQRGEAISRLDVGERSGITIPTRWCFRQAGYIPAIKRHGARAVYFDESKQVPVTLTSPKRMRDLIFVPKPVAETDFFVNLPKFKAHPWTRLTLSLKNYIGIQDDRHRLLDHNTFLEHKIADLQEVKQSDFIAVDAVIAGQKMMLTPTPFSMGAIVMGTNSCAVDTVGCHMVGVDPDDLIHLKYSSERGFGPMDINHIDVSGDFPLDEVRERNQSFQFCLERIDDYFNGHGPITCTVGSFPEAHSREYCWGGCPGALQEAMHINRAYYPDIDRQMKKVRYVVGKVEGPLNLAEDERVIFAGDCCEWEGDIGGEHVKIESEYKSPEHFDARATRSNDMILKILGPVLHCMANRSSRYIRARGCPVSVGSHVNYLAAMAKIANANFDFRNIIPVNVAYWRMRMNRAFNRIFG